MSNGTINRFKDEFAFLSNFYKEPDGTDVEHEYQASKTDDPAYKMAIQREPTAARARALGRSPLVPLKKDWDQIKGGIMYELVRAKFKDPVLRDKLLATGDACLVEGNNYNDTFFGVCRGVGKNMLGIILMRVRAEIRASLPPSMAPMCEQCLTRLIGKCCSGVTSGETCLGGSGPTYAGMA